MSEKYIKFIIKVIAILAPFLFLIGLLIGFINLKDIGLNESNAGYVTAIFSMTAILLYFAALIYQIKEYKLQIIELKKSVEAQTISSKALQEQKQILLEQSLASLIFSLLSDFKQFKKERDIHSILHNKIEKFQGVFALRWRELTNEKRLNKTELNEKFANEIKNIFSELIMKFDDADLFKQYVQFAFNILTIIDENKENIKKDYYSSTFYIQLTEEELLLLSLADIVDFGLPHYNNFHWRSHTTQKLINLIKSYKGQIIDYSEIDIHVLTNTFIKLKN
jgi:hypothetical protein